MNDRVDHRAPQRVTRRTDPDRRDRIIDACLDVIATGGVAGTSHRKVAAAADVPLGSMTYHFDGIDELLRVAFTRFADGIAARFEEVMAAADSADEARAAVIALMAQDVLTDTRELAVTLELYTLAAREPAYRAVTQNWMERSRAALQRHFDPVKARQLDALIEGFTLHRALATEPDDTDALTDAVDRIIGQAGTT